MDGFCRRVSLQPRDVLLVYSIINKTIAATCTMVQLIFSICKLSTLLRAIDRLRARSQLSFVIDISPDVKDIDEEPSWKVSRAMFDSSCFSVSPR